MLKEFKEFALRGNVVDLAVGVVIGAAFGKIVSSLVADVIMPPLGNEFNNMLKTTSLLAFISVRELFQDAEIRYSSSFKPVEYFSGVALLYLFLTTLWGFVQKAIERKFSASDRDTDQPTFMARTFNGMRRTSAIGGH